MKVKKILLVDDDKLILSMLKDRCQLTLPSNILILTALNYKDGVKCVLENKDSIHVAIIDLNLPDAAYGQMADYTLSKNIPTIILTASFNEKLQEKLMKNNIIDYIYKDKKHFVSKVTNSIEKILENYSTTVLIVDDSKIQINLLKDILQSIKLHVLTASNGEEALRLINNEAYTISLVLTDYIMPKIDGMELTISLREKYDKDELGIIALSSNYQQDSHIATKFIKIGANDYIDKPYNKTAVIARINSILHTLYLFKKTKELVFKDFLTGAYNRRYFYNNAQAIFDKAKRTNKNIAIATLDIDKFKIINDTYGHDVGDICIINVVNMLKKYLRSSDLISRFGGEEFVVLVENISKLDLENLFERIRKGFEENKIYSGKNIINFTLSIGISYGIKDTLEDMLKLSDILLYQAKETGRNKIVIG